MDKNLISQIVNSLADVTRKYVEASTAPLLARISQLEKSIAEIPSGPKGDRGDAGADGKDVSLEKVTELVTAAVSALPKAKDGVDGKNGADGKDCDPEIVAELVRNAVAALPKPKDGVDGKDGTSVHPDTVYRMLSELVTAATSNIKNGQDGAAGRDAVQIDILPCIDATKSYSRGTYGEFAGGVIRAIRNTDPITDSLEKSGWVVSMNGIAGESEEILDEGRTIRRTTTYTSGRQVIREFKTSVVLYRGVFKHTEQYQRGDFVTWSGSVWHCESKDPTSDEPGTGNKSWRLAVKRGRDGKDVAK